MTMHPATAPTAPPLLGTAQHLPPGGLIAIVWTSVVLAGIFVAARTVIRTTRTERIGWDDYWVFFAYAMLVLTAILQSLQTPHLYYIIRAHSGLAPIGEETVVHGRRYVNYERAIIGLFWTVLWSIKASFLAFYWKLFQGLVQYKKWWVGVTVFSFLAYVGCWIASANVCHQLGSTSKGGILCNTSDAQREFILVSYSTTADVLSDIMIICLPLNLLYKVRLATKQKLGLAAVFSLGLIIVVFAIARASNVGRIAFKDGVLLALWGITESTVSVIVGCLPAFKPLFHGRRGSSTSRHTWTPDLIPLRPYRASIRVHSTENSINAEARPRLLHKTSTWLKQIKVYGREHKEPAGCPETGINVRSDFGVKSHDRCCGSTV